MGPLLPIPRGKSHILSEVASLRLTDIQVLYVRGLDIWGQKLGSIFERSGFFRRFGLGTFFSDVQASRLSKNPKCL